MDVLAILRSATAALAIGAVDTAAGRSEEPADTNCEDFVRWEVLEHWEAVEHWEIIEHWEIVEHWVVANHRNDVGAHLQTVTHVKI